LYQIANENASFIASFLGKLLQALLLSYHERDGTHLLIFSDLDGILYGHVFGKVCSSDQIDPLRH
jgi:hypothetical protein